MPDEFQNTREMTDEAMGGECRMAGVADATPTLPVPHQHFVTFSIIGHTNFDLPVNTYYVLATPTLETILRPWMRPTPREGGIPVPTYKRELG